MSYEKITRKQAIERITAGKQVIVAPSKVRPDSMFSGVISRNEIEDFDKWENSYIYYNCNKETGNRPSYYVAD